MQKKQIANNLIDAFAHANLLLSIARDGEIALNLIPEGLVIGVLSDAAATYLEKIDGTEEGQIAMLVISNLLSTEQRIDDIIFVAPNSVEFDGETLSYGIIRKRSNGNPTLH